MSKHPDAFKKEKMMLSFKSVSLQPIAFSLFN